MSWLAEDPHVLGIRTSVKHVYYFCYNFVFINLQHVNSGGVILWLGELTSKDCVETVVPMGRLFGAV
jgi:hypothetical protein